MTYTGTVKDVYWRQWMRSRIMIEENERNNTHLDMINVEAPYLTDILFKGNKLTVYYIVIYHYMI